MTQYPLNRADRKLLERAATLLQRVVAAGLASPARLISVGKVLHAVSQMPRSSAAGNASISVIGPRQLHGEIETYYWWDVGVEDKRITIGSGGHFDRPSTGGDTFTSMRWEAYPGHAAELADYRDQLSIVPGLRSFLTDIPTVEELSAGFELSVSDDDNDLLENEDSAEDEDEEDGDARPEADEDVADEADEEEAEAEAENTEWMISPQDEVEQRLAKAVNSAQVDMREPEFAYGIAECGVCGCDLAQRGLMVDGRLKGSLMWGNLCASCFAQRGEGIGYGVGQLYARQPDGSWRLVAGFRS